MAKGIIAQNNFTGGEVSPAIYGRVDLQKYYSSLAKCSNFLIRPEGGIENRPGFEFCALTSETARLIPFQFSADQSRLLVFQTSARGVVMRVIADGALVLSAQYAITNITKSNDSAIMTSNSLEIDDAVVIFGVQGMVEINNNTYTLVSASGTTIRVEADTGPVNMPGPGLNTTDFGDYVAGGTVGAIYELELPYTSAQLKDVKYVQSADVMYLTHPSHPTQVLSRTADNNWTITPIQIGVSVTPPASPSAAYSDTPTLDSRQERYVVTAVDAAGGESGQSVVAGAVRDEPWPAGETITVSWSAVTGATQYFIYKEIVQLSGSFRYVGQSTTTSFVDTNISPDQSKGPPEGRNPFTSNNHPSVATFYEERLAFGAPTANPQTVYASRTGDYTNFDVQSPVQDSDAIEFTIAARQVNSIRWMIPMRELLLLTSGAIWRATGGGQNSPLSPASIRVNIQEYRGAANVEPITVGDSVVYVQAKGQAVRDLFYSINEDAYTGTDLSILAKHLFDGFTILDTAFTEVPVPIMWFVRSDGKLLSLTYMRDQEVWGWSIHETDGEVLGVTSIGEGARDALYAVIKRGTLTGVERLSCRLRCNNDYKSGLFMDAGLRYDGAPTSIVYGLWHLRNKDVVVLADGFVVTGKTVDASGRLHLDSPASKISVGLGYTSEAEALMMAQGGDAGLHTRRRILKRVWLRFKKARGVEIAQRADMRFTGIRERTTEGFDQAVDPYSGVYQFEPLSSWQGEFEGNYGSVIMRQTNPLPCTILSLMAEWEIGG